MRALFLCGLAILLIGPAEAASIEQEIADARALVSQEWKTDLLLIEAIASAGKCDVINDVVASADFQFLAIDMKNELINARLINDPMMTQAEPLARASRAKGLDESSEAYCRSRWNLPIDRARFRNTAQAIFSSHLTH